MWCAGWALVVVPLFFDFLFSDPILRAAHAVRGVGLFFLLHLQESANPSRVPGGQTRPDLHAFFEQPEA